MFSEYIHAALARAEREPIEEGDYCATIPGHRGVIATGETIEERRRDLIEVLEGWISFRLRRGMSIPPIGGKTIELSAEPGSKNEIAFLLTSPAPSPPHRRTP